MVNYSNQELENPEEQAVLQFVSDLRKAQNMAASVFDCNGIKTEYCLYNISGKNYNITCYAQSFELPIAITGDSQVCFYPITETKPVLTADIKTFIIGETEINISDNGQIKIQEK